MSDLPAKAQSKKPRRYCGGGWPRTPDLAPYGSVIRLTNGHHKLIQSLRALLPKHPDYRGQVVTASTVVRLALDIGLSSLIRERQDVSSSGSAMGWPRSDQPTGSGVCGEASGCERDS